MDISRIVHNWLANTCQNRGYEFIYSGREESDGALVYDCCTWLWRDHDGVRQGMTIGYGELEICYNLWYLDEFGFPMPIIKISLADPDLFKHLLRAISIHDQNLQGHRYLYRPETGKGKKGQTTPRYQTSESPNS